MSSEVIGETGEPADTLTETGVDAMDELAKRNRVLLATIYLWGKEFVKFLKR